VRQAGLSAIVFAAAPVEPTRRLVERLATLAAPYVVAADRGAATALDFGYQPDVVIGDFDSLDAETRAELDRRGVPIEIHPRDKDATDGQLAIVRALQAGATHLWLVGFVGGPRLDQTLANLLLLTTVNLPTTLLDAHNEATLARPDAPVEWRPEPSEIVSLIPVGSNADGVTTEGLRWSLHAETLVAGDTRAVSNEPVSDAARVSLHAGALLVTRHFPENTPV
jgi:thiamine pyrophosphokinase